MEIKSRNFYDVVQREIAKAKRIGVDEAVLNVPDKQQKGWEFQEVQESLQKLNDEGYQVRTERLDSDNDFGFFGYLVWVSVDKVVELD